MADRDADRIFQEANSEWVMVVEGEAAVFADWRWWTIPFPSSSRTRRSR